MKALKTSTVLAAAGALLLAASAVAGVPANKDYVDTKGGNPVVTKFGDCVLTKWDSKSGDCVSFSSEMRTVYFNFNSSALTPAAKTKLNALAKALKSKEVSAVKIIGYADEVGTDSYNLRLSQKRANAVAAYLRGKGVKVVGKSEVRGLGETSSKSDCDGQAGKALHACLWRDRRAEVEIVN
jgi:outer membrane protein OmpA-like peptidoglycan-associated protein